MTLERWGKILHQPAAHWQCCWKGGSLFIHNVMLQLHEKGNPFNGNLEQSNSIFLGGLEIWQTAHITQLKSSLLLFNLCSCVTMTQYAQKMVGNNGRLLNACLADAKKRFLCPIKWLMYYSSCGNRKEMDGLATLKIRRTVKIKIGKDEKIF